MITFFTVFQAFLMVTALSTDAFVSSFAYGAKRIRIPFSSVMIINLICSGILAVALYLGKFIGPYIPQELTTGICFSILLMLGLIKIFDSAVKAYIRKYKGFQRKLKFKLFSIGFILNVYADPEEADMDHSKVLSPYEGACLAIALSLDSIAVGLGTGITDFNPLIVLAFSLVSDLVAIMLGCFLGNKVARKTSVDLTWVSGTLLILLGVMKLF